jgi:hypothetical protein
MKKAAPLFVCLLISAGELGAQARGRLAGQVVAHETGEALPYSIVAVPSRGSAIFADSSGRFVLHDLPAGALQLNIRRLGFTPSALTVHVNVAATDTIRVALARVTLQLETVTVRAIPSCRNPGAPTAARDSTFAAVFEQLLLNAQQYRLLSEQYPFIATTRVERSQKMRRDSGIVDMGGERLEIDSRKREPYRPGRMVRRAGLSLVFLVPTLVDFADPDFVAAHCFHFAGVEPLEDSMMVRIDFTAADRLRTPDVNGSIYLDPRSYQIRRTFLHLSRKPMEAPDVARLEVVTDFREVLPSIPLIATVWSRLEIEPKAKKRYDEMFEFHRLLEVKFVGAIPGRSAQPKNP